MSIPAIALAEPRCPCGSSELEQVLDLDRALEPYPLALCQRCALLFSLGDLPAADFYRSGRYREAYGEGSAPFCCDLAPDLPSLLSAVRASAPSTVMELGCGDRPMCFAFGDAVSHVACDPDSAAVERARERAPTGALVSEGGVEQLEASREKADLLVLHHVLEHVDDPVGTLERLRDLLAPSGLLYVGVPGLYTWDLRVLFQSAHRFQFTASSLRALMALAGFAPVYADERIASLWAKTEPADAAPNGGEVDRVRARLACRVPTAQEVEAMEARAHSLLLESPMNSGLALRLADRAQRLRRGKLRLGDITTVNKIRTDRRLANVRSALGRALPDLGELAGRERGREAVILGGGPSADGLISTIAAVLRRGPSVLLSTDRMLPWCARLALVPDYVVTLDAGEAVADSLRCATKPEATFLTALHCEPEVFEAIGPRPVAVFSTPLGDIGPMEVMAGLQRPGLTILNAGGSVVLGALSCALTLGCRRLHIFGFDCHVGSGRYAAGIGGNGDDLPTLEVEVAGGGVFRTTAAYVAFAQQFFDLVRIAATTEQLEDIRLYGDSLVSAMSLWDIRGAPWQS